MSTDQILILIYIVLGYLAVPHTIWADKVVISNNLFVQRLVTGAILGWALIPWWILKMFFGRR